jgi:hypothetical protein
MRNLQRTASMTLALLLVLSVPARAQAVRPQPRPTTTPLRDASTSLNPTSARLLRQAAADPVSDGITYGALIGAGAAITMIAISYANCDGTCDAPEPLPMYLTWAGFGAGVGALTGWLVAACTETRTSGSRSPLAHHRGARR